MYRYKLIKDIEKNMVRNFHNVTGAEIPLAEKKRHSQGFYQTRTNLSFMQLFFFLFSPSLPYMRLPYFYYLHSFNFFLSLYLLFIFYLYYGYFLCFFAFYFGGCLVLLFFLLLISCSLTRWRNLNHPEGIQSLVCVASVA